MTFNNLEKNKASSMTPESNSDLLVKTLQDLEALKKQLHVLEAENIAIKKSISFKVSCLIFLPFRKLINLFKAEKQLPQNPILASCDRASYSAGYLEIKGWALSVNTISHIEVYLQDEFVGNAVLGLCRDDVLQAHPTFPDSQLSGFSLQSQIINKGDVVSLKVYDKQQYCVELFKVVIPDVKTMSLNIQYEIFRQQTQTLFASEVKVLQKTSFSNNPLISIVVPVFNVEASWLDLCIESVLNQLYSNWQLCLYDDASTNMETIECLKKWQAFDSRITMAFGESNKGISIASNKAIKLATGEFVALLDHDDELSESALLQVVACLNQDTSLDFIYSDEDKIDQQGKLCDPHFKSDFNHEALLSHNYICHFSVIRKSIGDKIAWFRQGFEGSQDHDLFLRIITQTKRIHHIPRVLYHWRKVEGSTAIATQNKDYAEAAGKKAVMSYIESQAIKAGVKEGLFPNSYRVRYEVEGSPLVSIIIPFKNELQLLQACIASLIEKTSYENYEILLINNQSDERLVRYCKSLVKKHKTIKLLNFDEEFNFSKLNNYAVSKTKGDFVLFLNNDIEVINNDWLTEMVAQLQQKNVAAVGAKLLYEDNTIQHSGIVVNKTGAVHPNKGLEDLSVGYFQRANYVQYVSGCTAACLLVKKPVFLQVDGFDEEQFKVAYNDVDLCLKIRQKGYFITYTPYAKLYHYESKSRGLDNDAEKIKRFSQEIKSYQKLWGDIYKEGDPYYNPNLKQASEKIYLNIKSPSHKP